jgi:hypothetical protein
LESQWLLAASWILRMMISSFLSITDQAKFNTISNILMFRKINYVSL